MAVQQSLHGAPKNENVSFYQLIMTQHKNISFLHQRIIHRKKG